MRFLVSSMLGRLVEADESGEGGGLCPGWPPGPHSVFSGFRLRRAG